jgi:hypothetical protein
MPIPGILAIGALVVLAAGSWAVVAGARPVGAAAFDTFAQRQRLHLPEIVHDPLVRAYLATRRRWRIGGLVTAFVFAFGASLRGGRIGIDLGAAFLGWFAGAIVAEWRLNVRRGTARRTALLSRRTLRRYLGVPERVAAGAAVGVLLVAAVRAPAYVPAGATATVLTGCLIPAAAAAVTARHILLRPAADTAPAVDDALRSRSLHALCGAVTAYAGFGVAAFAYLDPAGPALVPPGILAAAAIIGGCVGVARGPAA